MIDCIVCNLEFGLAEQFIFLPDGTQTVVPVQDLPLYIVSFTQNYKIYKVKIIGHPAYTKQFVEKIKEEEKRQYNKNILDIEILGGKNNE